MGMTVFLFFLNPLIFHFCIGLKVPTKIPEISKKNGKVYKINHFILGKECENK